MKSNLKVGDIIKCNDPDDLVDAMTNLAQKGIQTDFLYEIEGVQGYYLVIQKIERSYENE